MTRKILIILVIIYGILFKTTAQDQLVNRPMDY